MKIVKMLLSPITIGIVIIFGLPIAVVASMPLKKPVNPEFSHSREIAKYMKSHSCRLVSGGKDSYPVGTYLCKQGHASFLEISSTVWNATN